MALEVHPIALEARWRVEAIALIRPPAVHADVEQRLVHGPITARLTIGRPASIRRSSAGNGWRRAWIVHGSGEAPPFEVRVQDDLEMLVVQLLDGALRIGERRGVPGEPSVM